MAHTFNGKIVVITGALGALGSVLVKRFAIEQAVVYACFRGPSARFEKVLHACNGLKVFPVVLDVTSTNQITTEITKIIKTEKKIDILINNAGINKTDPFMITDDVTWDSIIDTNLNGVKYMCTAVARPMILARSGVIINVSSVLSHSLGRGASAYAASKAALERFTEIAAVELGKRGIRVNAVAPGLLEAGMGETMVAQAEQHAMDRIPLQRKGKLDEIADAILFLASDNASYITGHTLKVDGGLSCG